jgi:hypothetical protein
MKKLIAFLIVLLVPASLWAASAGFMGSMSTASSIIPKHVADHEEGDLTDYDSTVTDDGDLSATAAAALNGTNYGLSVLIDDTTSIYGRINLTASDYTATGKMSIDLYVDPNGLTMGDPEAFRLFLGRLSGSPYYFLRIEFLYSSSTLYLRVYPYNDAGQLTNYNYTLTDAEHHVVVNMTRATNSTSVDGEVTLSVDGSVVNTWSNVDTYDLWTLYQYADAGAADSVDAGTSGTFYIDEIKIYDNF